MHIYRYDESGTLQWIEHSIPFNGEVECSGCISEMIPNLEAAVINSDLEVKPDADGEERSFGQMLYWNWI